MSKMINEYKGEGQYATMDSAYMGDIMAQVGRKVWGMNMVGTVQCNRLGAPDTKATTVTINDQAVLGIVW